MSDTHYDASTCGSGLITPPLSPTKSTSTYRWPSPKTPSSPRKARSCFFFRNADIQGVDITQFTPPAKPDFATCLGAFELSNLHVPSPKCWSPPSTETSLRKRDLKCSEGSSIHRFRHVTRPVNRSAPDSDACGNDTVRSSVGAPVSPTAKYISQETTIQDHNRHSSEQTHADSFLSLSPTPIHPVSCEFSTKAAGLSSHFGTLKHKRSLNKLDRLPLRFSSSPLRPSQWMGRGGLMSPPRSSSRTPDRFISSRCSPNTTRESFELNKPTDRLTVGSTVGADPFSRRLHRSGRLNDELRSLRETYSVTSGRSNSNRRDANLSLRRSSFTLGVRQVSAGAVWNVGGSSPVSDTVVGVSNGRGGMLGSGTNAPLYTSMFLSRSDPEAELEAYERRLALAFDVDQADRVLKHSTPLSGLAKASSNAASTPVGNKKHVWRDNTWAKDSGSPCLLLIAPFSRTKLIFVQVPQRSKSSGRKPVPILPFRYVGAIHTKLIADLNYSS